MSSQDVSTAGSKDLETTTLVIASLVDRLNELTKELHELAKEALRDAAQEKPGGLLRELSDQMHLVDEHVITLEKMSLGAATQRAVHAGYGAISVAMELISRLGDPRAE